MVDINLTFNELRSIMRILQRYYEAERVAPDAEKFIEILNGLRGGLKTRDRKLIKEIVLYEKEYLVFEDEEEYAVPERVRWVWRLYDEGDGYFHVGELYIVRERTGEEYLIDIHFPGRVEDELEWSGPPFGVSEEYA